MVIDLNDAPSYPLQPTAASRAGDIFRNAFWVSMRNVRQNELMMVTPSGEKRGMNVHCPNVAKPLVSVKRMTQAGNMVCSHDGNSFILHFVIGSIEWLREENGNYMFDVWVVPREHVEASKAI